MSKEYDGHRRLGRRVTNKLIKKVIDGEKSYTDKT